MCTIKLRTTVLGVPTNPEPLDRQLCFSLYAATRAVTGLYREVLSEFGLTFPPQYLVLLALWEQDGLTVRELGERLQLDSGTLSPLLRRLERAGYTNREHSVEDARVVHVHLTREAMRCVARAAGSKDAWWTTWISRTTRRRPCMRWRTRSPTRRAAVTDQKNQIISHQ